MKTFSQKAGLTLLAVLALQACSSNPSVSAGSSIEEFARAVSHMGNSAGADWKDPTGNAVLLGRIRIEEADRRRALGHD